MLTDGIQRRSEGVPLLAAFSLVRNDSRDIVSYAARPSRETTTASGERFTRSWVASVSVPDRALRAYWKGRILPHALVAPALFGSLQSLGERFQRSRFRERLLRGNDSECNLGHVCSSGCWICRRNI